MTKPLNYLCTPYTKYGQGHNAAFEEACKAAGELMRRGMLVHSPIAHSHPIAVHAKLDPVDRAFWMEQSLAMLFECDHVLVLKMPGWNESDGIAQEIRYAEKLGKPISYLAWPLMCENGQ